MQDQYLKSLLSDLKGKPDKKKLEALALKNAEALQQKDLLDYHRAPTAEELLQFRKYAITYKKFNKKASKREIRKAVQENFHIRIFK